MKCNHLGVSRCETTSIGLFCLFFKSHLLPPILPGTGFYFQPIISDHVTSLLSADDLRDTPWRFPKTKRKRRVIEMK